MESVVKVTNLTKRYGNRTALRNVSLEIEKGKITGLLGPNGSGKTTFIKILANLLKQYKGEVLIDGFKPGVDTKKCTSYLPDVSFLNPRWTARKAFNIYKTFYDDFDVSKALQMAATINLELDTHFGILSKGNKEKLELILILARKAKLYILDEPIAGVDPITRYAIFNLIMANYNPEGAIIICTHLILDVQPILNNVIFLQQGEVIYSGAVEAIYNEGKSIEQKFMETYTCY